MNNLWSIFVLVIGLAFFASLLIVGVDAVDEHQQKNKVDKGKNVVEQLDADDDENNNNNNTNNMPVLDINSQQFRDILEQTLTDFLQTNASKLFPPTTAAIAQTSPPMALALPSAKVAPAVDDTPPKQTLVLAAPKVALFEGNDMPSKQKGTISDQQQRHGIPITHQDQAVQQQQQQQFYQQFSENWKKLLIPISFDNQQQPQPQPQQQQQPLVKQEDPVSTSTSAAAGKSGKKLSKRKGLEGFGKMPKQRQTLVKQSLRQIKEEPQEEFSGDAGQRMGMELRNGAERAMQRLDNGSLEINVYRLLEISLLALDFPTIDIELMSIVFNRKIDTKLAQHLKGMDAESVAKRLKVHLLEDRLARTVPMLANLLDQIETQTVNVWAFNPFRIILQNLPSDEHKSRTYGAMLFFYARLFIRLSTLLEAPFDYGHPIINTNKSVLSHREAQIIWMGAARKIILNEFSTKFELQFAVLAKLDEFETIADRLNLAQLAIQLTIVPIAPNPNYLNNTDTFMPYLGYLTQNNVACFIAIKDVVNVKQIVDSISPECPLNQGLTVTFLRLLIETTQQHMDQYQGQHVNQLRQIVNIYLKFYKNLITFIQADDTKMLIKAYKNLIKFQSPPADTVQHAQLISRIEVIRTSFKFMYQFLTKSVNQLEQFGTLMDKMVALCGENAEICKVKFMTKHCAHFLLPL